jgi:hypothetical protein
MSDELAKVVGVLIPIVLLITLAVVAVAWLQGVLR